MGGILGGGSPPPMPAPAPLPTSDDEEAKAAGNRERMRQLKAASGSKNIRHGAGGLSEAAPTNKKVLLGG